MVDVAELIEDFGYEDVVIFANNEYDTAFLGMSDDGRAVYDYDLMVEWLVEHDGMTPEEALEWIDYNITKTLQYYYIDWIEIDYEKQSEQTRGVRCFKRTWV